MSIEFNTTSPAPLSTQFLIQLIASILVSSRPPRAKTWNSPLTRLTSAEITTHCEPYNFAAWGIKSGLLIAPVLTLTLSAPQLKTRSKSLTLEIPPPTVKGIKTFLAVSRRISVKIFRPSDEAVIS